MNTLTKNYIHNRFLLEALPNPMQFHIPITYKIESLYWEVLKDRVDVKEVLRNRGCLQIPNEECVICNSHVESVDYLVLCWPVIWELWCVHLGWWGVKLWCLNIVLTRTLLAMTTVMSKLHCRLVGCKVTVSSDRLGKDSAYDDRPVMSKLYCRFCP